MCERKFESDQELENMKNILQEKENLNIEINDENYSNSEMIKMSKNDLIEEDIVNSEDKVEESILRKFRSLIQSIFVVFTLQLVYSLIYGSDIFTCKGYKQYGAEGECAKVTLEALKKFSFIAYIFCNVFGTFIYTFLNVNELPITMTNVAEVKYLFRQIAKNAFEFVLKEHKEKMGKHDFKKYPLPFNSNKVVLMTYLSIIITLILVVIIISALSKYSKLSYIIKWIPKNAITLLFLKVSWDVVLITPGAINQVSEANNFGLLTKMFFYAFTIISAFSIFYAEYYVNFKFKMVVPFFYLFFLPTVILKYSGLVDFKSIKCFISLANFLKFENDENQSSFILERLFFKGGESILSKNDFLINYTFLFNSTTIIFKAILTSVTMIAVNLICYQDRLQSQSLLEEKNDGDDNHQKNYLSNQAIESELKTHCRANLLASIGCLGCPIYVSTEISELFIKMSKVYIKATFIWAALLLLLSSLFSTFFFQNTHFIVRCVVSLYSAILCFYSSFYLQWRYCSKQDLGILGVGFIISLFIEDYLTIFLFGVAAINILYIYSDIKYKKSQRPALKYLEDKYNWQNTLKAVNIDNSVNYLFFNYSLTEFTADLFVKELSNVTSKTIFNFSNCSYISNKSYMMLLTKLNQFHNTQFTVIGPLPINWNYEIFNDKFFYLS